MKTLKNLSILCYKHSFIFILLLATSFRVFSQACHSTAPNPVICSGTVAENFSSGNGGFSATGMTYSGSPNFYYTGITSGNANSYTYTLVSPHYFKGIYNVNNVRAGFLASAGNKATITSVLLEVVRASDNLVLGSCTRTFSINDNLGTGTTVCIGVFNTNILSYVMFYYRFRLSVTNDNGSGSREIRFDNFSYGGDSNAPLPVDFSFFNAKRSGKNISLNWETVTEINNKGFEIQRKSERAAEFETIAFIPSKGSEGNSIEKLGYSFTDVNASSAMSYYRIRQVDFDGKNRYTEIRAVEGIKNKSQMLVYPNPSVTGSVTISFDLPESKHIRLSDISGRVLKNWASYDNQVLKIENLKPGIYLLTSKNITTNTKDIQRIIITQ